METHFWFPLPRWNETDGNRYLPALIADKCVYEEKRCITTAPILNF